MTTFRIRKKLAVKPMTTRRRLLAALGAGIVAFPVRLHAQQQDKVWRIGYLSISAASASTAPGDFTRAMRELGHVEGKHYIMEWRSADGKYERFPKLASDLVKANVDIIVVTARAANTAVQRATNTIPVVVMSSADPVAEGLAASLARPGGNITGLASVTGEASAKYLELLKILMPKLSRVGLLLNPGNKASDISRDLQQAGRALGVTILTANASTTTEIEQALTTLKRESCDAVVITTDGFFFTHRKHLSQVALAQRLPSIVGRREYADAGCLMSYGESLSDARRRTAYYVDRIMKGARPGDLPFEKPTRLFLVINRKTASAMNIVIPQELLLRADEVIG